MPRTRRDTADLPGPANPLAARLDWLPGNLTMLSVADTAHSVYPELIVGLPGVRRIDREESAIPLLPFFMAAKHRSTQTVPPVHARDARRAARAALQSPPPPFDAELVPDPDDLRPFLFPSVHALVVDDAGIRFISREAIPTLNPSTAVPIALAALVPAVRRAQLTSDRAQSTTTSSKSASAFHNFTIGTTHFPADIRGKDGKPLLSWRVAILPFLEQASSSTSSISTNPGTAPITRRSDRANAGRLFDSRREARPSPA